MKEIPATVRLARLGPVFTSQELGLLSGWSKETVQVVLCRWENYGYVRALGGHSMIYFNLRADADWHHHVETALQLAIPRTYGVGGAVLFKGGLMKHPPCVTDLAVPPQARLCPIENYQFHVRHGT